jgi:hypothetical protein
MEVMLHTFLTQQYMQMSHQLHALTAVSLWKEALAPIMLEMAINIVHPACD